ncbi:type VI secretion system ImpA family N-terminal domain-containing protein [Enterobacter ludwigii]|uniref:type VI secretion system ImpA family N-terminal domain-containing protein n=1 Tax=Enterobacter ludwigii TaxID=299767 RepID=UPI00159CAD16|nr:type VI secretion system ImpA family N-terminal domain-containing protein [Enterobacter ludwigii]QLA06278.1 type VI secretion system ImpA family N-terminal domain-containing protein [Enterobacter ludwigii]
METSDRYSAMNDITLRKIKTGGDPEAFPDYALLCDELSKQRQPARPDIDWRQVQTLCLRLFELNGVELQSACSYTLARMHIAGLAGMNDGLFITCTLVQDYWSIMWPAGTHARGDILSCLSQHLRHLLCNIPLTGREELNALYQSEKCLSALRDSLKSHKVRQVCSLDALLLEVRSAIVCLEKTPLSIVAVPGQKSADDGGEGGRLIRSAERERESAFSFAALRTWRRKIPLRCFAPGTVNALILCGIISSGLSEPGRPPTEVCHSEATLTQPPEPSLPVPSNALRYNFLPTGMHEGLLTEAPRLPLGYYLICKVCIPSPENMDVRNIPESGQKMREDRVFQPVDHTGRHENIVKTPFGRLKEPDEKQMRYLKVSELKTKVYAIMLVFVPAVPPQKLLCRGTPCLEESDRGLVSGDVHQPEDLNNR